ncbi:hypothetical protein C8A01DRAFT_39174 [Parachaetomium inaequale]|uniref:Uncharacterized protein n=1 Tax=Parachaetomium inaequale TaxID=2588326 RepID=A0AAN6SNP0_9PEZI|nr:hypothetical protein C8A01DRAFT_39174 [Parachaetomium inaequale]
MSGRRAFSTAASKWKSLQWLNVTTSFTGSWGISLTEKYFDEAVKIKPQLKDKVALLRYARSNGNPHTTPGKLDPLHLSTKVGKHKDFSGSPLRLHIYPNGLIKPSEKDFPTLTAAPPSAAQLGEHAMWADEAYIAWWKEYQKARNEGRQVDESHEAKK